MFFIGCGLVLFGMLLNAHALKAAGDHAAAGDVEAAGKKKAPWEDEYPLAADGGEADTARKAAAAKFED